MVVRAAPPDSVLVQERPLCLHANFVTSNVVDDTYDELLPTVP